MYPRAADLPGSCVRRRLAALLRWALFGVGLGLFSCNTALPKPKPCLSDEQCSKDGYLCIKKAPGDKVGQCLEQPDSCNKDSDCTAPAVCVKGDCKQPGTCQTDENCKEPGTRCIQGACEPVSSIKDIAVVYFPFDKADKASQFLDQSKNQYHGSWRQSGGNEVDGELQAKGYRGQAATLGKKAAWGQVEFQEAFKLSQLTVVAWVRPEKAGASATILRFCHQDTCFQGYALRLTAAGKAEFLIATANEQIKCQSRSTILPGRWTHIAGSFDGNKLRCFVNGRIEGEKDWQGKPTYPNKGEEMLIGTSGAATDRFAGALDEVGVFVTAQQVDFKPGLTPYLYVAGKSGIVYVIDSEKDAPAADLHFTPNSPGWPIAVSPNGKWLFLWDVASEQLTALDADTREPAATVKIPGGGDPEGTFATVQGSSLWLWGSKKLFVLPYPLGPQATPKELPISAQKGFGAGVAYLASSGLLAVSHTQAKKVFLYDAAKGELRQTLDLSGSTTGGERPQAVAFSPSGSQLYVSVVDVNNLKEYLGSGGKFQLKPGAYVITETVQDPDNPSQKKKIPRFITRAVMHPKGSHLFYTFQKAGQIYAFHLQRGIQDRISTLVRDGKETEIAPFVSTYLTHLGYLGTKLYIQAGNQGQFYVLDVDKDGEDWRLKEFKLPGETAAFRLPIAGPLHPSQAF